MTEETLFAAALEKATPDERAAFLDDACSGNPALRRRVEALLQSHGQADFLRAPAVGRPAEAMGVTGPFLPEPGPEMAAIPLTERPGTMIGPYKLLQQIGEGGMGTVFMAEQTRPVHRKVALKVIKPGMDSRQVVARFEAERQALAMMDHVNIARVLDAGATESGQPYFVMELVHGVPITKYCDDNHLTPRERLELFVPVCQAIQHAHQKGIIHRDIKPSNVMVTLYDGKPVPKVIDFGVAKATEQKLTERTLFTQYGTLVGTLEYMSPEQAEMSALGVDSRSDIYSLGVLLYELLTGSTPLNRQRMKVAAFGEILRMLKEEEPPKPSTRLSDSGEALASISALRKTEPAKLTKLVRGELDWIVMKSLEKDRNRRYETANGFAADVQRYLSDETVQACPPSAWYRGRKFARRNKVALGMATLIGLALVTAVAVLAVSNIRIAQKEQEKDEALHHATASELQAVTQAHRATIVADLLQQMLASANPEAAKGAGFTVRELLDAFSAGLDDQVRDQPEVEATIRRTIGRAYWQLGVLDAAEKHLARALDLRRKRAATEPKLLAQGLVDWAWVMVDQGKYALAETAMRDALTLYAKSAGAPRQILEALRVLQLVAIAQGQEREADRIAQEARELANALPGQQDPELACILFGLARVRLSQGKAPEAERLARESVEMHRRTRAKDHPELAWGLLELGRALAKEGKYADAEKQLKEALAIFRKHYPNDRYHGPQLVVGELAGVLRAQNKPSEADALQREPARRLLEPLDNHPRDINSWLTIGETLQSAKIWEMALLAYREAAKLAANADRPSGIRLGHGFRGVGRGLQEQRRYTECELPYREASRWLEKAIAESPGEDDTNGLTNDLASVYACLGWALKELNRAEEAVAAERKAVALWKQLGQAVPEGGWHDWYAHEEAHFSTLLAEVLESMSRSDDALEYALAGVRLHEELLGRNPDSKEYLERLAGSREVLLRVAKKAVELAPKVGNNWNTLGVAHYRAENWKAAIEALNKSDEMLKGNELSFNAFFLAMAHWQLGNKVESRKYYDQAVRWMEKNKPQDEELRRFRAEAEKLLKIEKEAKPK